MDLLKNGVSFTSASVSEEPLNNNSNNPTLVPFTFAATGEVIDPGDTLTLRVTNTTGTSGCTDCGGNRRIRIFMQNEVAADDLTPLSEDYLSRSRVLLATNVIESRRSTSMTPPFRPAHRSSLRVPAIPSMRARRCPIRLAPSISARPPSPSPMLTVRWSERWAHP